MALMDEIKKRTEEGLKTLKETAGEIAFNVEKQAKLAKLKMQILKIQRKIQKLYTEIGEYVYGEFAMARPLIVEVPFLAERIAAIAKMKVEIAEIEAEIDELRKLHPPSKTVSSE
jgi:prefoldin subunit 5